MREVRKCGDTLIRERGNTERGRREKDKITKKMFEKS